MSSCSSETDVIRTRITTCDEDDGVLYAYEPNTAYLQQQANLSDTSYEEQQKTVLDVLSHCQVIKEAVQKLDKNFDIIDGKVAKIYHFCTKLIRQNHKLLGYAHKHYTYLLSRNVRLQKAKKKKNTPPMGSPYCHSENYSPTSPVRRPADDSESIPIIHSQSPSQDSLIQDQESLYQEDKPVFQEHEPPYQAHEALYQTQELHLGQSPVFPAAKTQSFPSYYMENNPVQASPSKPCFTNPGPQDTASAFSTSPASTSVPADMLEKGRSSLAQNLEMMGYPALLESSLGHSASSFCIPPNFAPNSSVGTDAAEKSDDPLHWSVEEVILFLKQVAPEILNPIASLFRQHNIDGKALLLLHSEALIKHMGLKLGPSLKLCYYITKLKTDRCNNM